ncbi:MAG: hexose kinase [Chloroflexota bacterium]|nr:hexose kinase [Chloroflexota bacterium]
MSNRTKMDRIEVNQSDTNMILTVTPDPVLDKIYFIDEWLSSSVMHAHKTILSVGGKGLDSSVALSHLHQESIALCFLAGETGKQLSSLVNQYGIQSKPTWVDGETRCATIIAEQKHQRHTHLFSGGISVSDKHLEQFTQQFHQELENTEWIITGGIFPASLPQDFFVMLIQLAHQAGVKVLIDSHSQYIKPTLSEKPDVLKMNWKEFEWTFDAHSNSIEELILQAEQVYRQSPMESLVITCGAQGILAFTPAGIFHAIPPTLQVVNAAGAGDAASAALVWRLNQGEAWSEALRWAGAVSAAVVLTEGTADLHYRDVQDLLPEITLNEIPRKK